MHTFPVKAFRRFNEPRARAKRISALFASFAAALAVLSAPVTWAQEKVTLRVASFFPSQNFFPTTILVPYLNRVVADSKGTLAYEYFPGGTLGHAPSEQLQLAQNDVADIAAVLPSYTPGPYENYGVTELPGVAPTTEAASLGAWRAFKAGLLPEPKNVKVLGIVTTASNLLHMTVPTPDIASLSGKRIRAAGALQMSVIDKLGGAAVGNISAPGVAEALSRGVLDGVLMDWVGTKGFQIDRVAHYHVEADFGRVVIMLVINAHRFATLPDAAKASLLKNGGAAFAIAGGKAFDDAVTEYRANILKEGNQKVSTFPATDQGRIKATFDAVVDEWVKARPGRDKVLEAFRKGVAEAK